MTLSGIPLLSIVPNFEDDIAFKYMSRQSPAKSTGLTIVQFPQIKAQATLNFTYLAQSKAEAFAFISFWEAQCGMAKVFWCPSWRNQLGVTNSPMAGDTTLPITSIGAGYSSTFLSGPNPGFASGAYIFIYDFIHDPEFLLIDSVSTSMGVDTLNLDSALANNYIPGRFIAGLVYLVRWSADRLEETWLNEDAMEAKISMMEVLYQGLPVIPPLPYMTFQFTSFYNNTNFKFSLTIDGGIPFEPTINTVYAFYKSLVLTNSGTGDVNRNDVFNLISYGDVVVKRTSLSVASISTGDTYYANFQANANYPTTGYLNQYNIQPTYLAGGNTITGNFSQTNNGTADETVPDGTTITGTWNLSEPTATFSTQMKILINQ